MPGEITTYTAAMNRVITVHLATEPPETIQCTLTQGYQEAPDAGCGTTLVLDENGQPTGAFTVPDTAEVCDDNGVCVEVPVATTTLEPPEPEYFNLSVCTSEGAPAEGALVDPETGFTIDGTNAYCGTLPPPVEDPPVEDPTTTTTTTVPPTTTVQVPSGCSSGLHSHTNNGVNCHGHTYVPTVCGASYRTINGAGHTNHVVSCTTTTTTTTTLPPGPPTVYVTGVTVDEGAGSAFFMVRLSKTWTSTVYVDVDTSNGSATSGTDYVSVNRRVSVSVGATSVAVPVTILDDTSHESDETFTLSLSNPSNASLSASPSATSTIRDDDTPPPTAVQQLALTCTATSVNPTEFRLAATWDAPVNGAVSVQAELTDQNNVNLYAISASATSPYTTDVTAAGTYRVSVLPYLTGGLQGVSSETLGVCAVPVVSINDAGLVDEGGSLRYTVSMTPASGASVTVDWATTSTGTAFAGTDYRSGSGTVTFAAGETSKTVSVATLSDTNSPEADETVVVALSNAAVAAIGTATASGHDP